MKLFVRWAKDYTSNA